MITKEEIPVIILAIGVGFSMAGVHISYLEDSSVGLIISIIILAIFLLMSILYFINEYKKESKNDK